MNLRDYKKFKEYSYDKIEESIVEGDDLSGFIETGPLIPGRQLIELHSSGGKVVSFVLSHVGADTRYTCVYTNFDADNDNIVLG